MKNICSNYIIATILLLFSYSICKAHEFDEHNNELKETLFGTNYNNISPKGQTNFNLLCIAARLTLDYTNQSYGPDDMQNLKSNGVKNLPSIDNIMFPGNQYHQRYTHLGWEYNYTSNDRANWPARKMILLSTIEKIGKFKSNEQIKLDAFAALVYEIHILGDHIGDSELTRFTRLRLVSEHDYKGQIVSPTSNGPFNNPTLFVYLLYHIQRLFREQQNSLEYQQLTNFLNRHKDEFINDNPLNYDDVSLLAAKTKEQLIRYLPKLLERESFFKEAFFTN